jgi:uncharacterized membrane protein
MKKLNITACMIVAGTTLLAAQNDASAGTKNNMEKCYGVAKAGENDCASSDDSHSCAGVSTKDGDKKEWLLVPKGLCDKLVNGSTKPGK